MIRLTLTLIACAFVLSAQAEPAKVDWSDLIDPSSQTYDDPFVGLSFEHRSSPDACVGEVCTKLGDLMSSNFVKARPDATISVFGGIVPRGTQSSRFPWRAAEFRGTMAVIRSRCVKGNSYP